MSDRVRDAYQALHLGVFGTPRLDVRSFEAALALGGWDAVTQLAEEHFGREPYELRRVLMHLRERLQVRSSDWPSWPRPCLG